MDNLSVILIALAVHFSLAAISSLVVLAADIVKKEQKMAQVLVCLLIPFVGSLIIVAFTINEESSGGGNFKSSSNNTQITDNHGIDLHISHKQHQNMSSSDGSD
ncbi:MAG: hypothetical protein V7765_21690 [Oleispira sp.]